MNIENINDEEFQLEQHVNKCRCCFRTLIDEQKFVKITNVVEQKFFDLTQIKVSFESELLIYYLKILILAL